MANESFALPVSRSQYDPVQSIEDPPPIGPGRRLRSNERPPCPSSTLSYPSPTMNHARYGPPAQYTGNMAHDGPQPPAIDSAEQHPYQGNESVGHHGPPPGAAQHISGLSIAPGLPQLGYYTLPPYPQEMPYNCDIGAAPQSPNEASTSQGIPAQVPSGMSAVEDLRRLASRYLHSPDSHVDKVRVKQSRRSGRVKVMILLEIDDM